MKKIFNVLVLIFISVLLVACGYKPSSYYAKKSFGDSVYIEVSISRIDPENSVIIHNAITDALVFRFGSQITTKDLADTKLNVQLNNVDFRAMIYDGDGYVIGYKALVSLRISYILLSGKSGTMTTRGEYDFAIQANSVISDTKRFEAIRYASMDAIDEFISKVSVLGMMQKDASNSNYIKE